MLCIFVTFVFHSIRLDVFAVASHEHSQNPSFIVHKKTLLDLQCRKANTKAVRVELSHYLQIITYTTVSICDYCC